MKISEKAQQLGFDLAADALGVFMESSDASSAEEAQDSHLFAAEVLVCVLRKQMATQRNYTTADLKKIHEVARAHSDSVCISADDVATVIQLVLDANQKAAAATDTSEDPVN